VLTDRAAGTRIENTKTCTTSWWARRLGGTEQINMAVGAPVRDNKSLRELYATNCKDGWKQNNVITWSRQSAWRRVPNTDLDGGSTAGWPSPLRSYKSRLRGALQNGKRCNGHVARNSNNRYWYPTPNIITIYCFSIG